MRNLSNLKPFQKGHPGGGHKGHYGPYLTPLLKKLLKKEISFEDPETQRVIKGNVKLAIIWRYILNAIEGDDRAIEGIFDRIEGKVPQETEDKNLNITLQVINYNGAGDKNHSSDGGVSTSRMATKDITEV